MSRQRMSAARRRAQLIEIGRTVFAEKGFDGTSVEEIAARAAVSKPVIYEHFGGKEGLYQEVIAEDTVNLDRAISESLSLARSRLRIERAVLTLLTFAEENTEAFRILSRDNPEHAPAGLATLLGDSANRVSYILAEAFRRNDLNDDVAALYSQAMVGAVAMSAQWWAVDSPELAKEDVAAHIVNLLWNGLAGMEREPQLHAEVPGELGEMGARLGAGADADPAQAARE